MHAPAPGELPAGLARLAHFEGHGADAENVADAIQKVRPYAVDVCSQIESKLGKKDAAKVKLFIEAVKKTA